MIDQAENERTIVRMAGGNVLRVMRGAEAVAARLQAHVAEMEVEALLLWLMRGCREAWKGRDGEAWVEALGGALRAGARDEGGFSVRAELPVGSAG